MGLINFNKGDDKDETPETYNAATAMQKQLEQQQKEEEMNSLQQNLDDAYNKEFEKAHYSKPSQEVMAYYNIYRHWPNGHPLNEMNNLNTNDYACSTNT